MGFAASAAHLMALIARKHDLELEAQFINKHRLHLANKVTGLFTLQASLDPETVAARMLEARIRQLNMVDKQLEMNLNRIKYQRDYIEQEMQGTKRLISSNIRDSAGFFGGSR